MSQRKPASMSWDGWVDHQIRQAEASGAFASKSTGPIEDLDAGYQEGWWLKQLMEREQLKQAIDTTGTRQSLSAMIANLSKLTDEASVRRSVQAINERIRIMMRNANGTVRIPTLNEEMMVAQWQAGQKSDN